MKAAVCSRYGSPDVLQVRELKKPEPKDNEVLIKVFAATVHIGYTRIRREDPFLVRLVYGPFTPNRDLVLGMARLAKPEHSDLLFLKGLIERDRIRPVIDRTYALDDIVAAHRYVDTGRKRGNVALTM